MERPQIKQQTDVTKLKKVCSEYMEFINSIEYHEDNDFDQYIFEEALKAVFGEDVFKYINEGLQ